MTLYYHFKKYEKLTVNCICSLLICFLTWRCFTNQLFLTCVCHIRETINLENSYGKNQHYHTVYNDEANNDLWTEMQKSKHETFVYFWIPHFLFSNCIQRKILFFLLNFLKTNIHIFILRNAWVRLWRYFAYTIAPSKISIRQNSRLKVWNQIWVIANLMINKTRISY